MPSKCEIDRAVVFSFEYDRGKFLRRVFCGEEETMKLVSCFKDAEEAEEFFECFSGKEEGVEQLLLCPDGKRLSELRMDFNRNERREIGGACAENGLLLFKHNKLFYMRTWQLRIRELQSSLLEQIQSRDSKCCGR